MYVVFLWRMGREKQNNKPVWSGAGEGGGGAGGGGGGGGPSGP